MNFGVGQLESRAIVISALCLLIVIIIIIIVASHNKDCHKVLCMTKICTTEVQLQFSMEVLE